MRLISVASVFAVCLLAYGIQVAHADWTWQPVTNQMTDQRWAPSYCLLPGGKSCFIAGGYSFQYGWCIPSADMFDEATKRFVKLPARLGTPRDFAPATLLPDGTVMICGGFNDTFGSLNSVEIYHPTTKQFTLVDEHMLSPRELHTATLLLNGTVLIAGGLDLWIRHTQNTAEIYDPVTQTFTHTRGNMNADRFGHAACLLIDGRVLIAGGTSVLFGRGGYANVLASAEVFDPTTGLFTPTKSDMSIGRDRPTASLLPNGTVLIAGGQGPGGVAIGYAEIYDPKTETFSRVASSQVTVRMAHNAGTLPNGHILLTGGWCAPTKSTTNSVEEFDPVALTFTPEQPLPFSSHDAAQVVFPDGVVLVAGGKTVDATGAANAISGGAWAKP
jgi:hypothetical protein